MVWMRCHFLCELSLDPVLQSKQTSSLRLERAMVPSLFSEIPNAQNMQSFYVTYLVLKPDLMI